MKPYAFPVAVTLTAVLLVISCSNDSQLPGPSALPTSSPRSSSHLAVVPESSEVKSCGGAEEAAMRFSSPGFVTGTTVGMYVNFAGLPDGAKKLRIWWDYENQPAFHQDISLANDDPIKAVLQHTYNDAGVGDKRKVRVELIIEGHTNECIRVRIVELNDATGPVASAPTVPAKIVFVTSAKATANYNGLPQADTVCQKLATAAGLSGTFRAWLSNATDSPSTRFTQSTGPYKLVDGTQIADNWTDLTDGTIDNPINKRRPTVVLRLRSSIAALLPMERGWPVNTATTGPALPKPRWGALASRALGGRFRARPIHAPFFIRSTASSSSTLLTRASRCWSRGISRTRPTKREARTVSPCRTTS